MQRVHQRILLQPPTLLRLLHQQPKRQPIKLLHKLPHLPLLQQSHMFRNRLDHNPPQSLILLRRRRKRMARRLCKNAIIPEPRTRKFELEFREVLEPGDLVLVPDFVHFGVDQKLLGGPGDDDGRRGTCIAHKVDACEGAGNAACVVQADEAGGAVVGTRHVPGFAGMFVARVGGGEFGDVEGEVRGVFGGVDVVDHEFDYGGFVVWEVDAVLGVFLGSLLGWWILGS
jgi:hypothetical protein